MNKEQTKQLRDLLMAHKRESFAEGRINIKNKADRIAELIGGIKGDPQRKSAHAVVIFTIHETDDGCEALEGFIGCSKDNLLEILQAIKEKVGA